MFIEVTRSDRRGLESGEDQISTDVRDVAQAPKSDLMARGIAIDLLQMAKQVGPQCEPPNTKICPRRKVSPQIASLLTIEGAIKPFSDSTEELSIESTNVGVKTSGSRVGSPELCV